LRSESPFQPGVMTRTTPVEALPEFLSPEEVGVYLDLSRNTVYELLRQGVIGHVRLGRQIRIPKTALQQLGTRG